jgi:hypothetical protein
MTTCQIRGPAFVVCLLGTFATGAAGGAEPALYDVPMSGRTPRTVRASAWMHTARPWRPASSICWRIRKCR